jgi:hypothetical protein
MRPTREPQLAVAGLGLARTLNKAIKLEEERGSSAHRFVT